MKCETCNIEHSGKYGSGRFCCSGCAKAFSTKNKRKDVNRKISESLKGRGFQRIIKSCSICGNDFTISKKSLANRTTCSRSCGAKLKYQNPEKITSLKEGIKKSVEAGKWSGWKARTVERSYPEKYFIKVLENLGLPFEREKRIGKWFIDFAVNNIALEIDGSQHEIKERAESDKKKDAYLKINGWIVFRIKWYNPTTPERKHLLYTQIEQFKALALAQIPG